MGIALTTVKTYKTNKIFATVTRTLTKTLNLCTTTFRYKSESWMAQFNGTIAKVLVYITPAALCRLENTGPPNWNSDT